MSPSGEKASVALYGGERRHHLATPRLKATYAWLPPFEGASRTSADRLEVVFSRHRRVALEQAGRVYDVEVAPGGFHVVGGEPVTLLSVPEHSDTLEIYPNRLFLDEVAHQLGRSPAPLQSSLGKAQHERFTPNEVMLALAYVLRRACLGLTVLSAVEMSTLEHRLALQIIAGESPDYRPSGVLHSAALRRVIDRIRADTAAPLTLDVLAADAGLSPFHFARSFKRTTGLAPHQYVTAHRMELAKEALMTTRRSVEDIVTTLGFENLSHFRRQFRAHFGVLPGALRAASFGE